MKGLIAASLLAIAFSHSANAGNTDRVIEVCDLQAHTDRDYAYMRACGGWTSVNGCGSGGWVVWDLSQFQGKAMYSTALSALASGKSIEARFSQLPTSCLGSYDITTMIRIKK
jgi:hypothetical protein